MGRGTNWSSLQDEALARAWIEVTEDVLVGIAQNSRMFWARILRAYSANSGDETRTDRAVHARWKVISASCSKFTGCYEQANAHVASGMGEDDVVKVALATYSVDHSKHAAFELMDCWNVLKMVPKFKAMCDSGSKGLPATPTTGLDSSSADDVQPTSVQFPFECEIRPNGHKKAKSGLHANKMLDVVAKELQEQTRLQRERQECFELTTGALLFSIRDDQIPDHSREFFATAKKRLLKKIQNSNEPQSPPLAEASNQGGVSEFSPTNNDSDGFYEKEFGPDPQERNIVTECPHDSDGHDGTDPFLNLGLSLSDVCR